MAENEEDAKFAKYARLASVRIYRLTKHSGQVNVNNFRSDYMLNPADFKTFPWISTYPKVFVLTPGIDTYHQEDNMLRLIKMKKRYNNKLKMLKMRYQIRKKKFHKVEKAKRSGQYLRHVAEMAELLDNDPDKYFVGDHNWYFTGGTLDSFEHPVHGLVIFSAFGAALNGFRITRENCRGKRYAVTSETFYLQDEELIHQISAGVIASELCVLIRQMEKITILQLKDQFDPTKGKIITSSIPLVSALIEKENEDSVYTLDVEDNLRKWNVTESPVECACVNFTQTGRFRQKKKTRNWSTILSFSGKFLVYANSQQVRVLDKMNLKTHLTFNFDEFYQKCTEINCIAVSKFGKLLYVARNHDCFAVSISKHDYTIQMRWTHQLASCPAFMRTCLVGDNAELIAISGTNPGDLRILYNEREVVPPIDETSKKIYIYKSFCLPYKAKSMSELYYETRLQGECLDPMISLQKRINFSTSGMEFLVNSMGTMRIFTVNCIGDIYSQRLCGSNNPPSTDTLQKVAVKIRPTAESQKYHITGRDNLKSLERVFRCRQFNQVAGVEDEKESLRRRPRWRRSIKELKKYTDLLAPGMLAIWEMDDEEQEEEKILTNPDKVSSISAAYKVDQWLQTMYEETFNNPMEVEEQEKQEEILATPNQTIEELTQTLPPSQPTPRTGTQKKAKKKSHVIGF